MSTHPDFVFFGTPSPAAETLAALVEHGRRPALVVTNPDAPQGRGLTLTPSPVRALAESAGLPVYTPERLDEAAFEKIRAYGCRYALVVAYGKIFPETLIAAFPDGVLNMHYSLLPRWRGATPLEAALREGDTETGVTIQKMVKELDAGDILAQAKTPIDPSETVRDLRPRLVRLGSDLLLDVLPSFENGSARFVAQDPQKTTRAGKLKKTDGELDLHADAVYNWNRYRAYADTIGTFFFQDGQRVKITSATLRNGAFVVERVIPEGKREMLYRPEHV